MQTGGQLGGVGGTRIADGGDPDLFVSQLAALSSGVLQIAVAGGVVTPSTFVATAARIPFGSGTNGGLTDSANLTYAENSGGAGVNVLTLAASSSARIFLKGILTFLSDASSISIGSITGTLPLFLWSNATIRVGITADGRVYGGAIHNNPGAMTGTTNQYIGSGTYTPTLTSVTNVAASTARKCQWMRVGNVVTVSGSCDIDPTAAGATQLGISLPIASNLGLATDLGGDASADSAIAIEAAAVRGDAANDRAEISYTTVNLANHTVYFTFTYEVI